MKQDQLNSLIRTILTLVGAFMVGGGLHYFFGHVIDEAYWQEVAGTVLAIVAIAWSIATKEVNVEKLQGLFRQVVTFICGILVAKGLLNDQTSLAVISFVGSMVPYLQAGLERKKNTSLDSGKITINQLKK